MISFKSKYPTAYFILPLFFIASGIGYHLANSTSSPQHHTSNSPAVIYDSKPRQISQPHLPKRNLNENKQKNHNESPQEALPNERVLSFQNHADYLDFLNSISARKLTLLDQSDTLQSVRIKIDKLSDLSHIQGATIDYNYYASIPPPPKTSAQPWAQGFDGSALSWLGIRADNNTWGKDITVAVIDSGVNPHITFRDNVTRLTLTSLPESNKQLSHGTAVASIIAGNHPLAHGVAPASEILSIRVTDEFGISNSFTLASAIIQATDAGSQIINISMGSYANSRILANAVRYAQEKGSVIVAASGNEGYSSLAYPAAYPGVISVGAIEKGGEHLDFSNTSNHLSISAPGYKVHAAWGTDLLTSFSGTSASTPFISGAIAATLSEFPSLTPQQAAALVVDLSNDAGYPGYDPEYGNGILDLGRIMNNGKPGIYDIAIASQTLVTPNTYGSLPEVWVTIQNRGTETLFNSLVNINLPNQSQKYNISSLPPGEIQTFRVPVRLQPDGGSITITSSVSNSEKDINSNNNSLSNQFTSSPKNEN